MPQFIDVQTDFGLGQIDTRLHASVESKLYRKGLRVLENMLVTSERGIKKRFGTQFSLRMRDIEGDITKDNISLYILQTTPTQKLLVLFSPARINLLEAKDDGSIISIFSATTPYDTAQVKSLKVAQSQGVLLIFNGDVSPRRLSIKPPPEPPGEWQFTKVPFKSLPVYGFQEDLINSYTFSVSTETVGRGVTLTVSGVPVAKQPFFTDEYIGGIFLAEGGVMQLDGPIGGAPPGSEIDGTVIVDFEKPLRQNIPGKEVFISQKAISDDRGWPIDGVFYSSRLWLVGTRSLPNAVFGSAVQDFFSFTSGRQNSGDPIDDILQGDSLTFISDAIGNKTLVVFTNEGPYATQMPFEAALSPTNTTFLLEGSETIGDLPATTLGNSIIFINAGGKILWGMTYDNNLRGYDIQNLSITASELLNGPKSQAVLKDDPESNSAYVLIVNSDGTIASLTSNTEAKINAWSKLITNNGTFEGIYSLGDFSYVLVDRNDELVLERIDFTKSMDSFVEQTFEVDTTTIFGLSHLEGLVVEVIADEVLLPLNTNKEKAGEAGSSIVKNGRIILLKGAKNVLVGLDYKIRVIPLPINVNTDGGNDLFEQKTTTKAVVSYFESLGIEVNGQLLDGQEFSVPFVNKLALKTGEGKVQVSKGYEPFVVDVEIIQDRPVPVYIRAIARYSEV